MQLHINHSHHLMMRGQWLGTAVRRSACKRWTLFRPFSSDRKRSVTAPNTLTLCSIPSYRLARKSRAAQKGSSFPFTDDFELGKDRHLTSSQLIELLSPLMVDERLERFERVVSNRTFNVLPIVEGLYDMGNLAAVFRTSDALGFGAVHCIRNKKYKQSRRASGGAEKWLDVQLWDDTRECLTAVKEMGFQIVATHISPTAVDISHVDWTRPTAVVLGNEKEGVSETTLSLADHHVKVPMVGFVESFNVSVAAALILYQARATRLERMGHHGDLNEEERRILKALMFLRNKGQTNEMVQNMLQRLPHSWQIQRNGGDWGGKFNLTGDEGRVTRCHYWDGQQCYGEALFYPGKRCTHAEGHHPGASSLNKHKLQLMCEAKGVPLPPVLLAKGRKEAADGAAPQQTAGQASAHVPQEQRQQQTQQQEQRLTAG